MTVPLKCEPQRGSFPTSSCSETPFNSSYRLFTAAVCNISTGCSKVARFNGVAPSIIFLTPCLFKALILPLHVIQSTIIIICLIFTYDPSKDMMACISDKSWALAASTPYVLRTAQISLHCMRSCMIDAIP